MRSHVGMAKQTRGDVDLSFAQCPPLVRILVGWLVLASKFTSSDETGYTYDMKVYVRKDRRRNIQDLTATHVTML
jgi:hypothetical protein